MLARSRAGRDRRRGARSAPCRAAGGSTIRRTVHVLDDGFQHFRLERDVDLLVVDPADLADPRLLPSGRLREPLGAARLADAVLCRAATDAEAEETAARWASRADSAWFDRQSPRG